MSIYGFCNNKCKHEVYTKDETNDKSVVVNSTKPTTNEKVWIKKGKNLINPSNLLHGFSIEVDDTVLTNYENGLCTEWIAVASNTTYTLSGGNRCRFQFKNANGVVTYGGNSNYTTHTFTTLADTQYVRIYVYDYYEASISYPNLPKVQLEQHGEATQYEAYAEKEIYVRNNNGVYEEFYKKEEAKEYTILNTPTHSSGTNSYMFKKTGNVVVLAVDNLWVDSIEADKWIEIGKIPEQIKPEKSIQTACIASIGTTGNVIAYGKVGITHEGIIQCKMNSALTSSGSVLFNIVWVV